MKTWYPTVTCTMLTKDRPQFVEQAVACFESQTYPSRELIVIDDGEPIKRLLPRSKFIQYYRCEPTTISHKRNLATSLARGEIIIHWDDDDWSAPGRIATQIREMQNGRIATGFHTIYFTDGIHAWRYHDVPRYAVGTSLCYRKKYAEDHPFPCCEFGEDNVFLRWLWTDPHFRPIDGTKYLVARFHEGNTCKRDLNALHGETWQPVALTQVQEETGFEA